MLSAKLAPIGSQREPSHHSLGGISTSPQPATKPTQQSLAIQVAVLTEKLMQAEDIIADLRRREEAAKKASQVLVNELKVGPNDNLIRGLREDIILLKKTRDLDSNMIRTQCNEILQAVQNSVKKRDNLMGSRNASVSKEKYRDDRSPIHGEISSFPRLADLEDEQDHMVFKGSGKKNSYRAISTDFAEDDQTNLIEDLRAKIHTLNKMLRVKDHKISELSALLAGGDVTPRGYEQHHSPRSRNTIYLKSFTIVGTRHKEALEDTAKQSVKEVRHPTQDDKNFQFPSARNSHAALPLHEAECCDQLPEAAEDPHSASQNHPKQLSQKPNSNSHPQLPVAGLPLPHSLISSSHYNLLRVDEAGIDRDISLLHEGVRRDLRQMFDEYPSPSRDQKILPQRVRSTKGMGLFSGCTTPVQGKQAAEVPAFPRTASRGSLLTGEAAFKLVVGRFQSVGDGWMDDSRPLPMFDSIQTQMGRTGAKSSRTNLEIPANPAEILETKAEDQLCDDSLLERPDLEQGELPTAANQPGSSNHNSTRSKRPVPLLQLRNPETNLDVKLPSVEHNSWQASQRQSAALPHDCSVSRAGSDLIKELADPATGHANPDQHVSDTESQAVLRKDGLNASPAQPSQEDNASSRLQDAKENTPPPGFHKEQPAASPSAANSPFALAEQLTPGALLQQQEAQPWDQYDAGQPHSSTAKNRHQRGLSNTFGAQQLQPHFQGVIFRTEGVLTRNSSELNLERQFEADIEYARRVPHIESRDLGLHTHKEDESHQEPEIDSHRGPSLRRKQPDYGSFGHPHMNYEQLEVHTDYQSDVHPEIFAQQPKIAESILGDHPNFRSADYNHQSVKVATDAEWDQQLYASRESFRLPAGAHYSQQDTRQVVPPLANTMQKSDLQHPSSRPATPHRYQSDHRPQEDHLFNLTKSQFPQTLTTHHVKEEPLRHHRDQPSPVSVTANTREISPLMRVRRTSTGTATNQHSHLRAGTQFGLPLGQTLVQQGYLLPATSPMSHVDPTAHANHQYMDSGLPRHPTRVNQPSQGTLGVGQPAHNLFPRSPFAHHEGVRTHRTGPSLGHIDQSSPGCDGVVKDTQKTNYADFWQGIKRRKSVSGQSNKSVGAVHQPQHRPAVQEHTGQGGSEERDRQQQVAHRKSRSVIGTQDQSTSKHKDPFSNMMKMPANFQLNLMDSHNRGHSDIGMSQLATKRTQSIGNRSEIRDQHSYPINKWVHIDDGASATGAAHSTTTSQRRHLHLKTGYCGLVKHIAIDLVEDSMSSTDRERLQQHGPSESRNPSNHRDQSLLGLQKDNRSVKRNANAGQYPTVNTAVSATQQNRVLQSRQPRVSKSPSASSKKTRAKVGIAEKARLIMGKSNVDDKSLTENSYSLGNSALATPLTYHTKHTSVVANDKMRAVTEPNENSATSLVSKYPKHRDKSAYTPLRHIESPRGGVCTVNDMLSVTHGAEQILHRSNTPLRQKSDVSTVRQMSPLLTGVAKYTTEANRPPIRSTTEDSLGLQIKEMRVLTEQSVKALNTQVGTSELKLGTPNLKSLGPSLSGHKQPTQTLVGQFASPSRLQFAASKHTTHLQKLANDSFRDKENCYEVTNQDLQHSGFAEKSKTQLYDNPLSNAKERELCNYLGRDSLPKSVRGSVEIVTELLVDRVHEIEKRIATHRDKSSTKKSKPSHIGSTNSLLANSRTAL